MISLDQKYRALLEQAERGSASASAAPLRLCFELLAVAGAIDRDCATRLGVHGLTEGRFVLLFLLHGADPQGLAPHALAERAGVTRATITGLLDGLERDGLVLRAPSAQDRRMLAVQLTPAGATLAGQLLREHTEWIAQLFEGWTQAEQATLRRLLARVGARTAAGLPAPEAG